MLSQTTLRPALVRMSWLRLDEGDLTQKVSLSFYDYSPDSGKLKTVHLTFDYDKRENEYFLTDKSDE